MNKAFVELDNETITVSNEKGVLVNRENSDNIEEILITENNLETIENTIFKTTEELDKIKVNKKELKIAFIELIAIAIVFVPSLCGILSIMFDVAFINLFFDPTIKALGIISLFISGLLSLGVVPKYIIDRNKEKRVGKALKFLENQRQETKAKLEELSKQSTNQLESKEIDYPINIIDTKIYFNKLKRELLLLEDYRRHKNKYEKLFKEGNLDNYLIAKKNYSYDKIEFIKNLITKELQKEEPAQDRTLSLTKGE